MREVLKHESVQKCTLCDVDKMVPEISRKYFPKLSCAFDDPRADVIIGDGFKHLEDKNDCYDVIIVDSSDPDGPASTLFGEEFFSRCKRALHADGILVTQAENMWIHLDLISEMKEFIEKIGWASVEYANISIPSYPSGCIGFFVCSKKGSCAEPVRPIPSAWGPALRYYDDTMHRAAFMLPRFVRNKLRL
jgi:spermidine synthase